MIIVIDALNKHKFPGIMREMFKLRARVFGERLGWDVTVVNGEERDQFDNLDPVYGIGVDDKGQVVSCVRALQTTGPHMLADVFSDILDGEPPLRSPTLWESTRFCVDTKRLSTAKGGRGSISHATCELLISALEYSRKAGVTDIVTVIDPIMDRILKRTDNAPYGYVGKKVSMGKSPALAALLDCTEERIARVRRFAGIDHDVFMSEDEGVEWQRAHVPAQQPVQWQRAHVPAQMPDSLQDYCEAQISAATTEKELAAAEALRERLWTMLPRNTCDA